MGALQGEHSLKVARSARIPPSAARASPAAWGKGGAHSFVPASVWPRYGLAAGKH